MIHNQQAEGFCRRLLATYWKLDDVHLFGKDLVSWNQLQRPERQYYAFVVFSLLESFHPGLSCAAASFSQQIQVAEAHRFWTLQLELETVHSQVFHQFLNFFVQEPHQLACVTLSHWFVDKQQWVDKWLAAIQDRQVLFGVRLAAFVIAKQVLSCVGFTTIFWLKHHQLMEDFSLTVTEIVRDRDLFVEFALFLYSLLETKPPSSLVNAMLQEAVICEKRFIYQFPPEHIGLDSFQMEQFVEYIANTVAMMFREPLLFPQSTTLPFDWIQSSSFHLAATQNASIPHRLKSNIQFCLDAQF